MLSVASDLVGLRLPTSLCLEYGSFALFVMIELMIQVFIEVRITYSSPHDQLPAVRLYLMVYLSVCCSVLQCVAVCCSVLQCVRLYLMVYLSPPPSFQGQVQIVFASTNEFSSRLS
jgi:hypothetical protein